VRGGGRGVKNVAVGIELRMAARVLEAEREKCELVVVGAGGE